MSMVGGYTVGVELLDRITLAAAEAAPGISLASVFTVAVTDSLGQVGTAEIGFLLRPEPTIPPEPTAPTALRNVQAIAGNRQATVTWQAPASTGYSPITGYAVTGTPGGSASAAGNVLTATVSGLTNGTAYTFTVTATNAIGISPPSAASPAVTPAAGPPVVSEFTAKVTDTVGQEDTAELSITIEPEG
ncbi:MAG: fibronectin type III domain-containing protein [Acidimicrobiaceae bacterium]|nr:fibronectin type III domain-containing protein [Acidimicrobiaceae bacterium]